MSQQKVDRYKEYKKNKAKILKREKMRNRLEALIAGLVVLAFAIWIGWSVYHNVTTTEETGSPVVTELNADAYTNYLSGLQNNFAS